MKTLEKFIRFLAVAVGHGWLWGESPMISEFVRVPRENGEIVTYHPSFHEDYLKNDFWPYGSESERLFREAFPNEKITGCGNEMAGTYIVSRPVS